VGIENASTSSGAIMEQWEFDGGDYQKWILSYAGDGYYKIISAKSGLALSVQANKLGEEDEALVQELYDSEYRQQWKITLTSHGSFKIKARSSEAYGSDLVMCVGAFWLFPNGVDIEQRPYVDNTSYNDEWLLAYSSALLNYHISSTSFTIQCIGSTTTNSTWYPLIEASVSSWNNSSANTNISLSQSASSYTCEVDSFADDWYGLMSPTSVSGTSLKSAAIQINSRTMSWSSEIVTP
jgi:hypothetical protein